jgi:hypothetical protein
MRYIANILTDKKLNFNKLYNVVSDKNDLIEDIPTLVIGWEYTKNIFPNANILNWEIGDNFYWTYGNREKRNKYDENLEKFKTLAIKRFVKSVKYVYYNILTADNLLKAYILNIIENIGSNLYIADNMLYIWDDNENVVIGISLRDIEYSGKDTKQIFSKIYKNPQNHIITINEDELTWDIRNSLRNYNYVIPYLFN